MSKCLNRVQLLGQIGSDVRVRWFEQGRGIANFKVVTEEPSYNINGNEIPPSSDWHNVSVSGAKLDALENLTFKGQRIFLEGKLRSRSYEKDGVIKWITEIKCSMKDITLLSFKNKENPINTGDSINSGKGENNSEKQQWKIQSPDSYEERFDTTTTEDKDPKTPLFPAEELKNPPLEEEEDDLPF